MLPTNSALCAASPACTAIAGKQEMSAATEWLNVRPAVLTQFTCIHMLSETGYLHQICILQTYMFPFCYFSLELLHYTFSTYSVYILRDGLCKRNPQLSAHLLNKMFDLALPQGKM